MSLVVEGVTSMEEMQRVFATTSSAKPTVEARKR